MFKSLKFRGIITFSEQANQWIYYLQKLPLIGKHISDEWYWKTALKTAFGILGMLMSFMWSFLCKALYGLLFFLLPMVLTCQVWYPEEVPVPAGLESSLVFFYFLILNIFYGSLANTSLFEADEKDFIILVHFRVPAKEYLLGSLLWRAVLEAVFYVPILWLPLGFWMALLLAAVRLCLRITGEMASLSLYRWKGTDITKLYKARLILGVLTLALAYGLPFLAGPERILIVRGWWGVPAWTVFAGTAALAGLLSWRLLKGYQGYSYIVKRFYTFERIQNVDISEGEILKAEIDIKDEDMALTEGEKRKVEKLSGYEYLNALFFYRHKKLLGRSARRKQLVLLVLGALLLLTAFFIPEGGKEGLWEAVTTWISGVLVFMMYLLAGGQRICKAFFFHCDESLLKYGYYRQPEVLLKNFRIRLKHIMKLECQSASSLSLFFLLLPFALGKYQFWYYMLPVAAEALLLAVFFAMFHLFCYYVFQPYTAEATVKNPAFSFLNGAIYLVSYVCLQLREISMWFTIGVLAAILVFLPLAFFAIYRFAPKTFRVRG